MNSYDKNRITYLAITDSRNKRVPFGIKASDRTMHMYVIGKSGMGKSTLLENLAVQDIRNGEGFAFLDPHGGTAEKLLNYVPEERIKDVLYIAPFDLDYPVSFNVLEDVGADKRHLVVNGLMSAFKKIWVDAWSARMEYILNNIILALLEYPEATLLGVNRMLADKDFRKKVVDNVTDPAVKSFWVDEFAKYGERYMQEAGASIQNKTGQFVSSPLIRNMIGQARSSFNLREMMDNQKIVIINLSKGKVGEANANLLGSMLITKVYLAAMSRADVSAETIKNLPNFYLYVDEFQSFANESFANILSEARKYKLNLTIAHQYVEQMTEEVRAAVFGNVGTMITFRVGAYDAEIFQKEYAPEFTAEDMVNLGAYQIYLKLMIDGVTSKPFSATALPPIAPPQFSYVDQIIHASRETYARPRYEVEEAIVKWHQGDKSGATGWKQSADKNQPVAARSVEKPVGGESKNHKAAPAATIRHESRGDGKKRFPSENTKSQNQPKPEQKTQPFKDAFKAVGISKEEKEERENELRRAITLAYGGGTVSESKPEPIEEAAKPAGAVHASHNTEVRRVSQINDDEGKKEFESLKRPPRDPRSVNVKKDASSEHIRELKEALAKATSAKAVPENKTSSPEFSLKPKNKIEEVPEEVLRKLLDVDPGSKENNI